MSTRERFADVLYRAGALQAMMHLRRIAPVPSAVTILTYHHVAAEDGAYPYDIDVADAAPQQFRRQMEMLCRYGTPIGVDDLVRALDGVPLPKNPVMVTFDDGYRSCHDVALPILRAVGMRATFFVPSGFITERKLYWWERIAVLLTESRVASATVMYPTPTRVAPRDPRTQRILCNIIKNTEGLDVARFLEELSAALGVEWNAEIEAMHAGNLIMSWDHIRALSRAGMDVESHTRWHRVLNTINDQELRDELAGSRADLEAQLDRPIRAVAYPVGRRIAHIKRIREAVIAAGYRIGVTNASGVTRIWPTPFTDMIPTDRYDISRLSTDRSMSDAMYFTQVALPQLAYIGRRAT